MPSKGAPAVRPRRARSQEPPPGWNGIDGLVPLVNPRAPSVPAGLIRNLREYYTGCVVIGAVAAQTKQPNKRWLTNWAMAQGEDLARQVERRWRRKSKRRA